MAAVSEANSSLISKCMDFCQALASKGQEFHFSLAMGPSFTFSLDTRGKATMGPEGKKKKSPSTMRRNARRREEFIAKKDQTLPTVIHQVEEAVISSFTCEQCEYTNVSEKGLRQHTRMKHGKAQLLSSSSPSSPESLRQPTSYSSAVSKSVAMPFLADMEDREEDIRFQEEVRFHQENPHTCELCRKKCDLNVDMMEQSVVTGGHHSIPQY